MALLNKKKSVEDAVTEWFWKKNQQQQKNPKTKQMVTPTSETGANIGDL